jgi:hypothetical protein
LEKDDVVVIPTYPKFSMAKHEKSLAGRWSTLVYYFVYEFTQASEGNSRVTLYDALKSSLASLRYKLPPSHICPLGGGGSTFLVVYRAAIASMERRSTLGTW